MKDFIIQLKEQGVKIKRSGEDLELITTHQKLSPEWIERIKSHKRELIGYLKENERRQKAESIEKVLPQLSYALSSSQYRLWMLSQTEGANLAYNIPTVMVLHAHLDIEKFRAALSSVVERHEILRTVFKEDEKGEVRQWVLPMSASGFKIAYKPVDNDKSVDEYLQQDSLKPFDLEKGPLLRGILFQLKSGSHLLYINMHHIISDAWSKDIMVNEVMAYYQGYVDGQKPELPALRIQYKDYAAWQAEQLKKNEYREHREYWLSKLSGTLPRLNLPSQRYRPKVQTYHGYSLRSQLSLETSQRLKQFCYQHGGSLFMGILASWNVLLYRYTGQKEIIVGTPVSGREHADLNNQIGCYVNTLALLNEVDPKFNFIELFSRISASVIEGFSHQAYPFDHLIDDLNVSRDVSRNAIIDVMVTLQNETNTWAITPDKEDQKYQEQHTIEERIIDGGKKHSKFDLEIVFNQMEECLHFEITFNTNIYERGTIVKFMRHYTRLLSNLLQTPEKGIGVVPYLSNTESDKLLHALYDTQSDYPRDQSIVTLFEEQVTENPESVAVDFEGEELTYRQLSDKSNQLAAYLMSRYDVRRGDLVGIQLERSARWIVAILGVLKSGAAYVPIDPAYPPSRSSFLVSDSNCKVVFRDSEWVEVTRELDSYSADLPATSVSPRDLAYVMYTSGSTGKPKGVMIEHRSVIRLVKNTNYLSIDSGDRLLGLSSFSFDGSTFDIFMPLLNGGTLLLSSKDVFLDVKQFDKQLEQKGVNGFLVTTALFNVVVDSGCSNIGNMKYVLFGGEQVSISHVLRFKEQFPHVRLIHLYGPTENTTVSTWYNIEHVSNETKVIPIGSSISNTGCLILDANLQLLPEGVVGEIYLGGDGLARGYLNNAQLTADKFVAHPFEENARLYKSGDLGRWLPDGTIEFVGRQDSQVKLRGYRVELEEIESAILRHSEITAAVVLIANHLLEKDIVCYYTTMKPLSAKEVRTFLSDILPSYMLPTYYFPLDEFPLTANGKIDKHALSKYVDQTPSNGIEYVAPRTSLEGKIVKIWENILQRDGVGVKDDFFGLGGHSLKVMRLKNEYYKSFDVRIPLDELFTKPILESHAGLIESTIKIDYSEIYPIAEAESYPLSDAQRRLWVLSQVGENAPVYVISNQLVLDGKYEMEPFHCAIYDVINRHEILRTVFKENSQGELRQWIIPTKQFSFEVAHSDLRKDHDIEKSARSLIANEIRTPFDLVQGPLIRVNLIRVEDQKYIFHYCLHHIISDGWSMELLEKEVMESYVSHQEGKQPSLPSLKIQYKDYASWQLAQLESQPFEQHRQFWLDKLSGELPRVEWPTSKVRPQWRTYQGESLSTHISPALTAMLKGYSQDHGGTLFMALLAIWNVLIYRYTSQNDIIIGSPIAGRDHPDLEHQIGFYVNTLVLRNRVDGKRSFSDFFEQVKKSTLEAYAHQYYPFDRLVEDVQVVHNISRNVFFDILFTLHNDDQKAVSDSWEEKLNAITENGFRVSKFDMEITFQEVGDHLHFGVTYNTDVYEHALMKSMIGHYKQLLTAIISDPEKPIIEIDYLAPEEKNQLLREFNKVSWEEQKHMTVVDLFVTQVRKTPNRIAIVFEGKELTYQQLYKKSNQLAAYLIEECQVMPGSLVGIELNRSEWIVISILAIIKCGCAYVPMDPDYPQTRLDYISQDSGCKLVIDEPLVSRFDLIMPNTTWDSIDIQISMEDLLYVIYTSGTTGHPKGVMVTHANLAGLIGNLGSRFRFSTFERLAVTTNITFDISVLEILGGLCTGKILYLVSDDTVKDSMELMAWLNTHEMEALQLTPSRLSQLYETQEAFPDSMKLLLVGGEALSPTLYKRLKSEAFESINAYAPTETTIYSTSLLLHSSDQLSIGVPLENEQIYILDHHRNLQPAGVYGEVYIGGCGISKGYLNAPLLTAEKFVDNPFEERGRIYRTGDIGRWLPDGNVEFVGRKDDQVKVRGHRVELAEIEHALLSHESIDQVVVLMKNVERDEALIAYFVSRKGGHDASSLRSYLKTILPDYMLPAYFVEMENIPITSNGKVDKKVLQDYQGTTLKSAAAYVSPRNPMEVQLADIWSDVLKRPPETISIYDSFFDLGGHSVMATIVISRIHRAFNVKVTMKQFFLEPTIASLSICIEGVQILKNQEDKVVTGQDELFF